MAPSGPELADISCACLIVLDGWGIAPPGPGQRDRPGAHARLRRLWADYPHAALEASGPSVGLPDGQMGNSEVGHLTLGAGAVVPQTLTLIDDAVADGALAKNPVLRDALSASRPGPPAGDGVRRRRPLRLRAPAGADRARRRAWVRDLVLHCFTDGRDTSPDLGRGLPGHARGLVPRRRRRPRRDRRRALLGDGPRPALGADPGRLRPARARTRRAPRAGRAVGRARRLRARRDRRVHPADPGRRGGPDPPHGQRAVLQLPPRPDAGDRARARRAGFRRGHRGSPRLARTRGLCADPAPGDDDRVPARAGPTRWRSRPRTPRPRSGR